MAALPRGIGLAYVIAGGLSEVELTHHTSLSIRALEVQDAVALESDAIYVVPPSAYVAFEGSRLLTKRSTRAAGPGAAADELFVALAQRFADLAIGLVVNPAEVAPWQGVEAIARGGGLTLAIANDTSPPNSSVASLIDHYLPYDRLADEVVAHVANERVADPAAFGAQLAEEVDACMPQICESLLRTTGHDFRHYKRSTLVRRTVRRLQVLRLGSAERYLARLADDRTECERLFKDLLINVTAFFRDPEAFDALATLAIRPLLERDPAQPLRIWVPGCATGEEAYSIAMLVLEQADALGNAASLDLQVFASDLDEAALTTARLGNYHSDITSEVSARRLERFFTKRGQRYQVTPELREHVLFSLHNLINDPPFSKVDLISCRNLLIYLGSHLQEKLVPLFHYALSPGGYLFLGPSESLDSHRELFRAIDQKHRISQRLPTAIRSAPSLTGRSGPFTHLRIPHAASGSPDTDLYLVMQRIVLDEFAPKAAVVDDDGRILSASGNLDKYMAVDGGPFQNSITRLVRADLRVPLRAALREAAEIKRKVLTGEVALSVQGGIQRVCITVQPMPQLGDQRGLYLVVFSDVGEVMREDSVAAGSSDAVAASLIERLERDLHATRRDLETSVQDLEAANEELKSSNEELLSMNEELQSANEELETSKEELQRANDALVAANNDLENLMASTRIATIFLDEHGALRRFTPDVADIYNVRPPDIGRPLDHYTHCARSMPPLPSVHDKRLTQGPIEDELELVDGRWFLRRVSPYRTTNGALHWLVLTFLDITHRRQATLETQRLARDLARRVEEMETLLRVLPVGIGIAHDPACERITVNPALAALLGVATDTNASLTGSEHDRPTSFRALADDREIGAHDLPLQVAARTGETVRNFVVEVVREDGTMVHLLEYAAPLFAEDGTPRGSVGAFIDVTERRRTEIELGYQLDLTRSITENATTAIFLMDAHSRCTFANPAALAMTGLGRDELIGHNLHDVTHPRRSDGTPYPVDECPVHRPLAERTEVQRHNDVFVRKDGQAYPVVCNARVIHREGRAVGTAIEVRDVTEERLAERRFQTLAESIPQLAWMAQADGNITWYNRRWYEYTGSAPAEMEGWGWQSVHDPTVLPHVLERWKRSLASGQPFDMVFPMRGADGVFRPFLTRVMPLLDEQGHVMRWFGTNTDISEQREMMATLERRERELQSLADNIPDVLLRYDRELRHAFVNRSAERLLGKSASELLGTHVSELPLPEGIREHLRQALEEALATQRAIALEYELAGTGAERTFYVSRIVPEHNTEGAVESALNVTHDRTSERLANEALREADHRKDEFLAMLAHELRNPLAPLRSGNDLLLRLAPDDPRRQRINEVMRRQLDHLTRLVDDLLDVSRISRGTLELKREIVDLRSVLEAAVESARPLLDEAKHQLLVDTPHEAIYVDADPARLMQVFGNLLGNAAKYTAPGGTVRVHVVADRAHVRISISDTGYGIDPEYLPRVFEMFIQVPRTKSRAQGGLGIGLALVRRLAELHGGTVAATSPGRDHGSTFTVVLPRHTGSRRSTLELAARSDTTTRAPRRVLIVDDNHDAAEMLADLLSARGHVVRFVTSGEAALDVAPMFLPEVVLLDIGLPDISGYDIAPRLRELVTGTPLKIVALTGWGSTTDQERSRRAGFDHHLTKPVSIEALLRALEHSNGPSA